MKDKTIPPQTPRPLPVSFSDSKPLKNVDLEKQSLLRDLLEGKLKPAVLREL